MGGRIGYPAQTVQLSRRTPGGAQALVCTKRATSGESSRSLRFSAMVALDNAQFSDPGPPPRAPLTQKELVERYAGDSTLWHHEEVMIDQQRIPHRPRHAPEPRRADSRAR